MNYIFKNKFYTTFFFIIDVLGIFFYSPFKFLKKRPGVVKNILLIRLDHIGDVVFSTVIPQNLKSHFKNTKITFLVSNQARDIFINNPFIDEVITFDAPWFYKKNSLVNVFGLIKKLRSYKFDLGIDLRGDFRHILIMALAGIRYKVGYGITGGGFLLQKQVVYRRNAHALEHNFDILRSLDIDLISLQPQIYSSQKDKDATEFFLKENNNFILIHSYASYSSKNWRDNYFAQLADKLFDNYKAKIIFLGSQKDANKIENIINLCNSNPLNFAGKSSLGALFEICKKAKFFIGVDSGPAHIAAAAGIPTIVLFSGTNKANEWKPIGNKVYIIEKDIKCKDCGRLDCANNKCMELILVEEVLNKVKEVI